jgi:FAD dependent oxidoreductase/Calx-beta domain
MKLPSPLLCFTLVWLVSLPARALTVVDSDVCIYGGTSGGVIAAVQSARMGKSVTLALFNNHVGGMTSGGLGATDTGNAGAIQGMSREFYNRIAQYYAVTAPKFTFEPKVAEQIFGTMLSEAGVVPRFNQRLAAVTKSGQRITEILMDDGTIYRARMFIDATYEGDLTAMAGVTFTIGRESVAIYSESLNGIRATTPSHQFNVNVDPYVVPGDSSSGLLPFIQSGNGGTPGDGDARLQAYNYRMCLTNNAANRLPIPAPPGYSESQYELFGRLVDAMLAAGQTPTLGTFMNISSMPNQKTDINNNGAFSTDFIGMNYNYPSATYAERGAIEQQHRNYIQGFFYYLGNSTRVPSSVRTQMLNYGFCADEFQDTGGFSHQLYVREARRMMSDYVMLQQNCQGTRVAPDSIGLGSYTMDSHNCQRIVQGGVVKNEGDVQSGTPAPYGISYRSIIPRVGECENLFVPFALSASHIAFGSIRMEPVFMILSQSAAAAAAFAIDDDVPVQQVDYTKLKAQLAADKQLVAWGDTTAGGIILDNSDTMGVTITTPGTWLTSTSIAGCWGANYIHDQNAGKGTKSVRFTPSLSTAGDYDVYLRWTADPNRADNVPVDVTHANGTSTFMVNQRINGGIWFKLGTMTFNAGTAGNLLIRTDGTNGFVIADAARFVLPGAVSTTVQIVASDSVAGEFGSNSGKASVVRTGDTTQSLVVNVSYAGTATSGMDYTGAASTVTIPAGAASQTITLSPVVDTLAEGEEIIEISLQPGANYTPAAPSSAAIVLLDRPFDAWRLTNFTFGELADPAISSAIADPDSDGVKNLLERALIRLPKTPEVNMLPTPSLVSGNLTLTYTRLKSALLDTNFITEWANDAGGPWMTAGITETILSDDSTAQQVRSSVPATGAEQKFLRLRISEK